MANELQPLSLLFQNRLFLIPDYQRGYAWLQQQLVDFWDDLVNLQADRYRTAHHHNHYADYRRKCGKSDNKALCVFVFVHIHKSHRYSEYQRRAYADKKAAQCYISRTAENSLYYRIKHLPLPHFLPFSFLCPCFV